MSQPRWPYPFPMPPDSGLKVGDLARLNEDLEAFDPGGVIRRYEHVTGYIDYIGVGPDGFPEATVEWPVGVHLTHRWSLWKLKPADAPRGTPAARAVAPTAGAE